MSLAENIKKFRTEKGMTQEQLGAALGVSAQAVSKWECADSYPDGGLLVTLANTLGVSLDRLFDNSEVYVKELSNDIFSLIGSVELKERMELIRELGWQMQKSLFAVEVGGDASYRENELKNTKLSSYALYDSGFTHISNDASAPFFSVFPEPEKGWRDALGNSEEMRKLFAALGSKETLDALLFLYSKENWYAFEAENLAAECGFAEELSQRVVEYLKSIGVVTEKKLEIDGNQVTLYSFFAKHWLFALLLMARETNGYCVTTYSRSVPFIR